MNVAKSRVMISFSVGNGGERIIENMRATRVDDDRYVLDNSPFYAYGVSFGDTVAATMQDGALVYSHVVARGGHSTYRIKLPLGRDHEDFLRHWSALEKLGCSYEGSSANRQRLYAVDLPPRVDVLWRTDCSSRAKWMRSGSLRRLITSREPRRDESR